MLLLFILSACLLPTLSVGLSCVGEDGEDTPWYALFKHPNGFNYYYAASNGNVEEGSHDLTSPSNPLGATLFPVYDQEIGVNYLMYNDQAPDGRASVTHGHTKGVVMWDDSTLVWLVHSVPNFPPLQADKYSYPDSARTYGQTALCLTLDRKRSLETVAKQLYITWPLIYEFKVAQKYQTGTLALVLDGKHKKDEPLFSLVELATTNAHFFSFAKTGTWGQDLYTDLVAPLAKTGLLANTWQNGAGRMNSNCTGEYNVWNVVKLQILDGTWTSTQDHSKWAISYSEDDSFEEMFMVCIGGINRMESQKKRGGGTFCTYNERLWNVLMTNLSYEMCEQLRMANLTEN